MRINLEYVQVRLLLRSFSVLIILKKMLPFGGNLPNLVILSGTLPTVGMGSSDLH
jgi:hypothetical protein